MAKRMKIPVYHMEAGNRCFDENVPEETNRRLVDHVADFNLVYTEHARRNLLAEGLHPRRILLTGSPMREVLDHYRPQIDASDVLDRLGLAPRRLLPGQRPPGGERRRPATGCTSCSTASSRCATRSDCRCWCRPTRGPASGWRHAATGCSSRASPSTSRSASSTTSSCSSTPRCVLSDSGTIARSRRSSGFPAVTLRDSIERPEALDTGGDHDDRTTSGRPRPGSHSRSRERNLRIAVRRHPCGVQGRQHRRSRSQVHLVHLPSAPVVGGNSERYRRVGGAQVTVTGGRRSRPRSRRPARS